MDVTVAARRDSVRLPSGRRLAWHEWGPADGTPVLFCTGAGMSGALGFGAAQLQALGLRLLAIDRPGLGASDPDPGRTFEDWTGDIAALLAARGLDRPLVVGFSQGAPFALAMAAAGQARAAAIVAGQDELAHSAIRPLLVPDVAKLLSDAHADPAGFEAFIAGMATADWLWDMVLRMSARTDRRLYERDPLATLYRNCLDEGFAQGAGGYARDLVLALSPWPFRPESVPVPVHLWYGRLDASPVHSPDHGATLAARIPGALLTVDEAAGGSMLWTHASDILKDLARHV